MWRLLAIILFIGIASFGDDRKAIDPSTAKVLEDFSSLIHHISDNVVTGSVLCNSAKDGDIETIKTLIERNVDVNITNKHGDTALHWGARGNFFDIVVLLIENDANVNAKNGKGFVPLHWAVAGGYENIVEILLINNADPNIKNIYNTTPLSLAAKNGYDSIVTLLIKFKAEVVEETNENIPTY